MKILVTGGTGYIGSHTAVELISARHEVVIVDNLINSKISVLDQIAKITGVKPTFYQVDLINEPALEEIFADNNFDAVIHFAGLKAVAESVEKPLEYYSNNLVSTLNLLKCMKKHDVRKIIFSSSATVYGDQGTGILDETMTTGIGITNPYGWTKLMIEQILKDFAAAWPELSAVLLRYFNPVGAHKSGLLGEDPNGRPNNLMPIIMKVWRGEIPELSVYGNDYNTEDGSCIRDYIHVVDLAKGHLAALNTGAGVSVYNLGTGRGTSVFEMVKAFETASGETLPYKVAPRRAGDLPELCANPAKAKRELGWKAELTISDAMADTLRYLQQSAQR